MRARYSDKILGTVPYDHGVMHASREHVGPRKEKKLRDLNKRIAETRF